MRTGAEYQESLRDGRKLWVMGEGDIADVTTHPATAPVVDEYANWLDRHRDPEWRDLLLTPGGKPRAFEIPMTADDFIGLSNAIYAQSFITGGNITHTPGYGALIALGVLDQVKTIGGEGCHVDTIEAYRNHLAETGTFLTLTGGASVLGDRFRDPSESLALKVVRETDAGLIVNGRTGMHTSTPYANDVYVTTFGMEAHQRALFVVAANSPGASIVARAPSARYDNKLSSPLSHRYDELDAQLWCDNVLVPWERVFAYKQGLPPPEESKKRDLVFSWLVWHHQSTWLAKADYTLGLTLAVVDSLGLKENPAITAQLIDLIIDCQTIRSCLTAANYEPVPTVAGYAIPNPLHMSSAMIYNLKTRQNITNILRNIPGSSLVCSAPQTPISQTPPCVTHSNAVSAAALTPPSSAPPCSTWSGTTSPQASMAAKRRSSGTLTAA